MKEKVLKGVLLFLTAAANVFAAGACDEFPPSYDCTVDGVCYMLDDRDMTATVTFHDEYFILDCGAPKEGELGVDYGVVYKGDVVIPKSIDYGGKTYTVTTIAYAAFMFSEEMTSVTIPNSVTVIEEQAFYGCTGLTSVHIPASVSKLSAEAFRCCSGLASITVDGDNGRYDSRGGCNAVIETETNTLLCGGVNTHIPATVEAIGDYAFSGCRALASVSIPESVTSIGQYTFYGCTGMEALTCHAVAPPVCGEYAFDYVGKKECRIYVPRASVELYRAADGWKDFANIIAIDDTGIDAVAGRADNAQKVYDIEGRRLQAPRKGLNIVDGRKVMVK